MYVTYDRTCEIFVGGIRRHPLWADPAHLQRSHGGLGNLYEGLRRKRTSIVQIEATSHSILPL